MTDGPRRASSMTFVAVGKVLDVMVEKLKRRWAPYLRGFEGDVNILATIARGEQHDVATQCYRDGLKHGARNERERLGLSPEADGEDDPTRPVPRCIHCGR